MKNKLYKLLTATVTGIVSWLALSYVFFPLKLDAPAYEYFIATVTHMIPLKAFITVVFVLFSLFVYEQKIKKE